MLNLLWSIARTYGTCVVNLLIFWPGAAPWRGAGKEDAPAVNLSSLLSFSLLALFDLIWLLVLFAVSACHFDMLSVVLVLVLIMW